METEKQTELRRKETLEAIEKLCLLDDNLMTLVFDRNIEATQLLLNVILQREDLKVLEAVAQREYKNPMSGGRSITIDIYATDDDNDPVGKLMHDFRCINSVDMFYPTLAKQVKYFKETEGGQNVMSQTFEELAEKWAEEMAEEMVEKRAIEEKKAFARRMIARGKLTLEEIAEDADLPLELVQELADLQLA